MTDRDLTDRAKRAELGDVFAALEDGLRERDLALKLVPVVGGGWCAWVFAWDDPALGVFVGEGDNIGDAVAAAVAAWDEAGLGERDTSADS